MVIPEFILEKKSTYTDHDRMFKELIKTFFQEFVEAFFPNIYPFIDFSTVTFLEQEVFTDILKGEKRQIDILAEVTLQDEERLILIHIEPQSSYQKEFHERMFIYCSRLYEKHRKTILPISIFSYNDVKEVPDQFTIALPSITIVKFNYLQLHLIKKNWRNFIYSDNPAAAALLSKMGYTEEERVQVRLEFLRMVSRMELDPAKTQLLYGFFDSYLKLNEEEEKQMREEVSKLPKEEADRVLELPNYYFDKGIEKGIEKGLKKVVYSMFEKDFPDEVIADITNLNIDEIKKLRGKFNKNH